MARIKCEMTEDEDDGVMAEQEIDGIRLRTISAEGEDLTCQFCHAKTWFAVVSGRVYDVGGKTLHVENCEKRKAFYKQQGLRNAQLRRAKALDLEDLEAGDPGPVHLF